MASGQRGVCVKHLNRCKTSTFELTFQDFACIIQGVGNEPVWTLYDGKNDKSNSIHDAGHLVRSSVSTSTSISLLYPASGNLKELNDIPCSRCTKWPRGSGACVKHLNRCKTSTFVLTFQVFTGIISRDFKQWNFYFCAYLPGFVSIISSYSKQGEREPGD